jgi:hypothetical protein
MNNTDTNNPANVGDIKGKASNKTLGEHIASRSRSPDFSALGLYLPNPDPILKKMGKDTATYRDLLSDAHVGGMVRRRKSVVRSMEWRLVARTAVADQPLKKPVRRQWHVATKPWKP